MCLGAIIVTFSSSLVAQLLTAKYCEWTQGRIHSGVVGVARPLGNHGNNLEAPICDLLELGSSGSSSGRGRRRLGSGRKRKKKQQELVTINTTS
ncbi:hypothetical protein ACFX2J_035044 [Malus domestica]